MKKNFIMLMLIMVISFTFIACGDDSGESSSGDGETKASVSTESPEETKEVGEDVEPVTIVYYGGWTGADLETMTNLVDEYNSMQDVVTVEFTSLQWSDMFTKFLADYQIGDPPDIVAMHSFEVGQFVEMGVLDDVQVSEMDLNESDYAKIAWEGTFYDNKQYGVPFGINMHALYYNKDMFDEAGIDNAPVTGEEFVEAARKLTIDNNGLNATEAGFDKNNIVQYGLGFAQNHHTFYQTYALMNQQGYNPFTADMTEIELDVDKTSNAINFIQDLLYEHNVTPIGQKSPIDDFKAGTVAMFIDGNWQLSGLGDVDFEWATTEYPQIFDEKAVWGATEQLAFSSGIEDENRKQAAREFVQWLAENSESWASSGQIPANLAAQEVAEKPYGVDAYYAEMDYVKVIPAHPQAVSIFSSKAPSPILTMADDTAFENKDAGEITQKLQEDINNLLK